MAIFELPGRYLELREEALAVVAAAPFAGEVEVLHGRHGLGALGEAFREVRVDERQARCHCRGVVRLSSARRWG